MRLTKHAVFILCVAAVLAVAPAGAEEDLPGPIGSVSGRVLVWGTPSAGRVEMRLVGDAGESCQPTPGEPIAVGSAGADGAFRLTDMLPGRYEIRALVEGHMPGMAYATVLDGHETKVVVPVLGGPHRLAGRLTWRDGRPFSGFIRLAMERYYVTSLVKTNESAVAEVDAEGQFAFERLPAGTFCLDAYDENRRFGLPGVAVPVTEELTLQVDGEFRRVRGRVTDALTGKPLHATVNPQAFGGWERVTTDAKGRYELWVHEADTRLFVRAEDRVVGVVEIPRGGDQEIDVRLCSGGTVSGRVLDPEGQPVEGVLVWSVRTLTEDGWERQLRQTASDADGRYDITHVAVGPACVFALGGGHASVGADPFKDEGRALLTVAVKDGEVTARDLVVDRAAALGLRITDAEDRPVLYARVSVVPDWGWYSFWGGGRTSRFRWADSDLQGRVEFPVLLPGLLHHVEVEAPGRHPFQLDLPAAAPGERIEKTVVLPPVRRATVRAIDGATGLPVAGARVEAHVTFKTGENSTFTDSFAGGAPLRTDDQGQAVIECLPEGKVRIDVLGEGYEPIRVDLPESGSVTVKLESGCAIEGRLEGPDALAGKSVTLNLQPQDMTDPASHTLWRDAQVVIGGRFRFAGLPPGSYALKAEYADKDRRTLGELVVEAPAADVVLRMEDVSTTRLRLRVLDGDGEPVPRARVVIHELEASPQRGARSRPERVEAEVRDGTYQRLLAADDAQVFVDVLDARDAVGNLLPGGAACVGPVQATDDILTLRLPKEQRLEGFVRDDRGRGIAGVRLTAIHALCIRRPFPHYFGREVHGATVTGADGKFDIGRLGPHEYRLELEAVEGFAPIEPPEVTLPSKPMEIRLDRATIHVVRVLDPEGRPVEGADVRVEGTWQRDNTVTSGRYWHGRTDASGRVRIPLSSRVEVRRLVVEAPYDREDLAGRRIDGWQGHSQDIRLPAARVIEGVVVDAQGAPATGVRVGLRAAGSTALSVRTTDAEGRFRFPQLEDGAYVVNVFGPGRPAAAVRAGARDVRLVLDL